MAYTKKYKSLHILSFNNPDMSFDFWKIKFRFGKEVGSDLDKRRGVELRCSFTAYHNQQGLNKYLVEDEGFSEECIGNSKTFYFTKHGKEKILEEWIPKTTFRKAIMKAIYVKEGKGEEKCYDEEGFAQLCIKFPFRNHHKGFDMEVMTSIHRGLEEIINLDKLNKYVLTEEK